MVIVCILLFKVVNNFFCRVLILFFGNRIIILILLILWKVWVIVVLVLLEVVVNMVIGLFLFIFDRVCVIKWLLKFLNVSVGLWNNLRVYMLLVICVMGVLKVKVWVIIFFNLLLLSLLLISVCNIFMFFLINGIFRRLLMLLRVGIFVGKYSFCCLFKLCFIVLVKDVVFCEFFKFINFMNYYFFIKVLVWCCFCLVGLLLFLFEEFDIYGWNCFYFEYNFYLNSGWCVVFVVYYCIW